MRKTNFLIGVAGIVLISIIFFLYTSVGTKYVNSSTYDEDEFGRKSFDEVKNEYLSNYSVVSKIPKKYYLRPEFYPNYNIFKNLTKGKQTGAYGYGAYSSEISFNTTRLSTDQYLDVYTFIHSAYGVGTYQGINLTVKSPDGALFKTIVDPSDILLSPVNITNPEDSDWAYRIRIRIIAKKDIPSGEYIFKLKPGRISPEKQEEYINIVNAKNKINNETFRYTDLGMIQAEKFFNFVLYNYD